MLTAWAVLLGQFNTGGAVRGAVIGAVVGGVIGVIVWVVRRGRGGDL